MAASKQQPAAARQLLGWFWGSDDARVAGALVGAVKGAVEMTVAQRMLTGQEGQRRYASDAAAFEQRLRVLKYHVEAFQRNGCRHCGAARGGTGG